PKEPRTTIFSTLNKMNCVSIQILNLDRSSSVAEGSPSQAMESWNLLRHLVEQPFNAHEAVLARDVVHEFVEKLPFRTGLTFRLDRLHEFLHTTLDIGEGAPLFRVGASREKI